MKRKQFLRNGLVAGLASWVAPKAASVSTYDKLMQKISIPTDQVGYNHLPNQNDRFMNTVLHKANTRGHANHGWLDAHHTFSFANYYNPDRMHFGVLRVLNDDRIAGGRGFGTHPHDNMEIITIPLSGDLEHKDSMGNKAVIRHGDVQVMSAGTGIRHSEYNANADHEVKLLQIWLFPNKRNVTPRYDELKLEEVKMDNKLAQILSPSPDDEGVWIHQDAWFHLGNLKAGSTHTYDLKKKGNGVYAFVIEGEVNIADQALELRDGLGIWDMDRLTINPKSDTRLLLMEVPMELS